MPRLCGKGISNIEASRVVSLDDDEWLAMPASQEIPRSSVWCSEQQHNLRTTPQILVTSLSQDDLRGGKVFHSTTVKQDAGDHSTTRVASALYAKNVFQHMMMRSKKAKNTDQR